MLNASEAESCDMMDKKLFMPPINNNILIRTLRLELVLPQQEQEHEINAILTQIVVRIPVDQLVNTALAFYRSAYRKREEVKQYRSASLSAPTGRNV